MTTDFVPPELIRSVIAFRRYRNDELRVSLERHRGSRQLGVRYWRTLDAGETYAPGVGVVFKLDELDALVAALRNLQAELQAARRPEPDPGPVTAASVSYPESTPR